MDYLGPAALRGMLDVLTTADSLHICQSPVSSTDSLKSSSIGKAFPRFMNDGSSLVLLPVKDGRVTADGTATHWALTRGGEVLASAPLHSPKSVSLGLAFTLTRIEIGF